MFLLERMTMSSAFASDSWRRASILAVLVLVVGLVYVGKTWSPSSYGHVLRHHLGYAEGGPDWDESRPIRSDEWGVVTPLTQATIFNGYSHIILFSSLARFPIGASRDLMRVCGR